MASKNTFGQIFQMTSFGESHGAGLGVIVDGCPAGIPFDEGLLAENMQRRRPGVWKEEQKGTVTARKEEDQPEILSGVFEGKTLGTPIAMLVRNKDARSEDYKSIAQNPRRGHADDTWKSKFGHSDPRGGGRSSGRETLSRVLAGSVAEMLLKNALPELKMSCFLSGIGPLKMTSGCGDLLWEKSEVDQYVARFPDADQSEKVREILLQASERGESYGAEIALVMRGAPKGLGQPVFHKLKADLAAAFLSIGAVQAFEIGAGWDASRSSGTSFHAEGKDPYGGIRGGISTGDDIVVRLAIKPTSSILDVAKRGRHDPCIGIRAVPVVLAMSHLVFADHFLWHQIDRLDQIVTPNS